MPSNMRSMYKGYCPWCGRGWQEHDTIWFNPGHYGYYCSEDCAVKHLQSNTASSSAQSGTTATYSTSVGNNASERKETTIMEAHEENIIAQTQLTTAVKDLAESIEHLTGMLRIMQSWSENMSKPIEGKGSQ